METFPNMAGPGSSSKVTVIEVAYRGSVSVGTVSRVINNDTHVAPETRERDTKLKQEMGFFANRQARSLRGRKNNVIGSLVPDLVTGYIGEIMHGIDNELALAQLNLMLFTNTVLPSKRPTRLPIWCKEVDQIKLSTKLIIRGSAQFPKHKAGLPSEVTGLAVWNSLHRKEYHYKMTTPFNPLHSIVNNSFVIR